MLDPLILVALGFVGLAAGFVDAIAGGGGMLSLPALLSVGVPPIAALATNKMQSIVGTTIAVITYRRGGFMSLRALMPGIAAAVAGSFLGAWAVKSIDTSILTYAVPVALICIAIYFLFAPKLDDSDRAARLAFFPLVPVLGLVMGFYDGVFGPGTGSFLTMAFITLFGLGVTRASAHTKALNMASNLGALLVFLAAGDVLWPAAIVMALGQIVGGYLGARTGIRFGAKLIRPLIVVISILMAGRLILFR